SPRKRKRAKPVLRPQQLRKKKLQRRKKRSNPFSIFEFGFSIARAWTKQQSGLSPVSEIPAWSTRQRDTTSGLLLSISLPRSLDVFGGNRQNGTFSQRNAELCFWSSL